MDTSKFVDAMAHNHILTRSVIIGITLCLLIFILTLNVPVFGFFIALLLPQPVVFFRLKLGKTLGAIIPIAAFLIIMIVMKSFSVNTFFYGTLLLTGFLVGNFIEKHLSIEKTILYAVFSTIGICLSLFFLFTITNENSFFIIISNYVTKNIELSFKIYSEIGMDQKVIDTLIKSSDLIKQIYISILPSMLVTMLVFTTWLNILIIKKILKRNGVILSWLGILNQWKTPDYIVWFAILSLLSLFIPIESIKIIGLNVFIVLLLIYFFQGIANISFFFYKKKVPLFVRYFIYAIIIIQPIFAIPITGLGFFDIWFDFRKLNLKQNIQN